MVVIHRAFGYRFVIYTQDHVPAHVHVIGEGEAKFDLLGAEDESRLVWSVGIPRGDLRKIVQEARLRRGEFLKAWERIHGR
jgi:hypothetical protein